MKQMFKALPMLFVLSFLAPYDAMAQSYPSKVGEKLGTGIANVVTGVVEIPKTMIVTSRTRGPAYGSTVGFMTGIVHMLGRTLSGAVDLATFVIPTRSLVNPSFIWNNFDRETSYNPGWQLR